MGSGWNLVGHLLWGKLLETRNLQFWPVWFFQLESQRATYIAWWADQADKFYTWVYCAKHCRRYMFVPIEAFHDGLRETKKMVICWLGFPEDWPIFAKETVVFKMFSKTFLMTRSKSFIIALSKLMGRQLVVCKGGLSGLLSIQRTATFQKYGIKPRFRDMVKARAKILQNPVPIAFLRMML